MSVVARNFFYAGEAIRGISLSSIDVAAGVSQY
jgi:hypothetical protein